jgi:hypothetical protein
MKTFEEKWTAWVDDQLTGRELEDFLASLPDRASAEAEKQSAKQLGALLRHEAVALQNADFFNHQLRERLNREDRPMRRNDTSSSWWTIPRLLFGGATSLAIFVICALIIVNRPAPRGQSQYLSQILNARVDPTVSPNATISMFDIFENKEQRVTVIWLDGLQSLPPEYAAK